MRGPEDVRDVNVWVSDHAADRFAERVRPGLDRRQASVELARLLREFGRRVPWPAWHDDTEFEPDKPGRFCLEISDGIVVVVDPESSFGSWPLAITVLTRGGHSEGHHGRAKWRRRQKGARVQKRQLSESLGRTSRVERRRGRMPGVDEAA